MHQWTESEREAARDFITKIQPHNAAVIISNFEEMMPESYRMAFRRLFDRLKSKPVTALTLQEACALQDQVRARIRELETEQFHASR